MKRIKIIVIFLILFSLSLKPVFAYNLGNPNSVIKVVEYSDYQCPFCRRFELKAFPYIYKNYIKKGYICWDFKDYPLINIHAFAYKAAVIADCSGDKYMEARYLLFKYQKVWKTTGDIYGVLIRYINLKKIKTCVDSGYSKRIVDGDLMSAYALGLRSTPSFVIYKNGKYLQTINGYHNEEYWYLTLNYLLGAN